MTDFDRDLQLLARAARNNLESRADKHSGSKAARLMFLSRECHIVASMMDGIGQQDALSAISSTAISCIRKAGT